MSTDSVMPTMGERWTDDPQALISSGVNKGYKQDTCVWNVAWNVLHAQGKDAAASHVATLTQALVAQFNKEVEQGKIHAPAIANANDVTTGQLTALAKAFDPQQSATGSADATAYHPFIGPLPQGVARPVVDSQGQIVPGSNAGELPPGTTAEWPFIGPLAVGVPRPLVDVDGRIVPGSNAGVQPPA